MFQSQIENTYQRSYYEKFKNLSDVYEQFKFTNSCQEGIISIKKYSMNSEKNNGYSPSQFKENKFYHCKSKNKLLRSTYDPRVDTSLTNISNLSNVKSDKKLSEELFTEAEQLRKQNQLLKQQVKFLKSCLGYETPIFQTEDNFLNKITKLETEKSNLKRIIEKSYYSLKQLQNENDKLISEQSFLREKSTQAATQLYTLEQKISHLQTQNYNLRNNAQNMFKHHQDEVQFLYERIQKFENVVNQMSLYVQADRMQWKKQQQQLQNIKKHYKIS